MSCDPQVKNDTWTDYLVAKHSINYSLISISRVSLSLHVFFAHLQ
jgi:hypothetical protein